MSALLASPYLASALEEWCNDKPIHGRFSLTKNCGLLALPGQCTVNHNAHSSAVCLYQSRVLSIEGVVQKDGELPRLYRSDTSTQYRLFTVHGGSTLKLSKVAITGGDISLLSQWHAEGGAIYVHNGNVFLHKSLIENNKASSVGGGGVYLTHGAVFDAQDTIIRKNIVLGDAGSGGGIFATFVGTKVVLNASWLIANRAKKNAGGMHCSRGVSCSILNQSAVSQNTADVDPGAVCSSGCFTDGTAFVTTPWCLSGTKGSLSGTKLTLVNVATQPKNNGVCTDCLPGTISRTRNAKSCLVCRAGKTSVFDGDECIEPAPSKSNSPSSVSPSSPGNFGATDVGKTIMYSLASLLGVFLVYKTCVFMTLKTTGRLNPDMAPWKAFLFTLVYGNGQEDHVLPNGERRRQASFEMQDSGKAGLLEGGASENDGEYASL